ncbi:MAG: TetR/AcrR family transcriptional regulator [Propionicimonas sp.]
MAEAVKTPNTYRQEQAQATRDRIAAAARALFAVNGYRMTSMAAIAQKAGVAERTVYTSFGAKREILSAICETWLEDAHARDIVAAAVGEPDPMVTVRHAAHFLRSLFETGYDVMVLFDAAAAEDPRTRAMLRAKLAGRNHVQNLIVDSLAEHLVTSLTAAGAIYRALAAVGIYQELVIESGWTVDDYEQWLVEELARQLLGRGPVPAQVPLQPAP